MRILAITYKPKIDAVYRGVCNQTIRAGWKSKVGDKVLLHAWEGAPYRSKWSWRKTIVLGDVFNIVAYERGFLIRAHEYIDSVDRIRVVETGIDDKRMILWSSDDANYLASRDFISPPTGEELKKVLSKWHDLKNGVEMQILRWRNE